MSAGDLPQSAPICAHICSCEKCSSTLPKSNRKVRITRFCLVLSAQNLLTLSNNSHKVTYHKEFAMQTVAQIDHCAASIALVHSTTVFPRSRRDIDNRQTPPVA